MKYKFAIGQKILAHISGKNWDDEYEVPSVIVGLEIYVENGIPVYTIKTHYGEIMAMNETKIRENNE